MIISASRRTDIPAFYIQWFLNRIRAGYCTVVNPYNRDQVSYVSLIPDDVDMIVFWTKNADPLLDRLDELDQAGYRYYFQYSINGYPKALEKNVPDINSALRTFNELSQKIGPDKVIWRYDPVCLSNVTDARYHQEKFNYIAKQLRNSTRRVVISIVDKYKKAQSNFRKLEASGIRVHTDIAGLQLQDILKFFVETASQNNLEIYSCAEIYDLSPYGIACGKCIDNEFIKRTFKLEVSNIKDKFQRQECGCIESKDIGAYDTCLHGCSYCYAGTLSAAFKNREHHDPNAPSLLGWYDAPKPIEKKGAKKNASIIGQIQLF